MARFDLTLGTPHTYDMTFADRVLIWLLVMGLLAGGYETLAFAQGWEFGPIVFGIALAAFAVGLIGFIAMLRRSRNCREAT